MEFAQPNQNTITEFSEHPLSPLFFEYISVLKRHHFLKEAEDLLAISREYYLPENRNIITKIIVKMQEAASFNETNKFQQYLRQLQD